MVGDDPSAHSSSNETDSRPVSKWLDIPMIEPGDFQEAKDMLPYAYEISEEFGTICMLRSVTRVAHARGNVKLGEIPKVAHKARFDQYYDAQAPMPTPIMCVPSSFRHMFQHMRIDKIREKFESSAFNQYVGPEKPDLLIVTAGTGWLYSQDAVNALKAENCVGILKLGTLWPLQEKLIKT